MATYRIGQVASLLAVSVDTVRTWIDEGRIAATRSDGGHRIIDGKDLAEFLQQSADLETEHGERISASRQRHGPSGNTSRRPSLCITHLFRGS